MTQDCLRTIGPGVAALTSVRTRLLHAPFSWGKMIREGKSITASMAATRRTPERLLAFSMTSVAAVVMRSNAGRGMPVEVRTLPYMLDVIPHKPRVEEAVGNGIRRGH